MTYTKEILKIFVVNNIRYIYYIALSIQYMFIIFLSKIALTNEIYEWSKSYNYYFNY